MSRLVVVAGLAAVVFLPGCAPTGGQDALDNQAPTADFTFEQGGTGSSGQVVSFDGSGSSDPDGRVNSYVWSFGDGSSALGAEVLHIYQTLSVFQVTLTVTDNLGATDTKTRTVNTSVPVGSAKWSFPMAEGTDAAGGRPAIGPDDTIYVTAPQTLGGARLYAINRDGTQRWVYEELANGAGNGLSDPVISKGTETVYVTYVRGSDQRGGVIAFSFEGAVKWAYTNPHDVVALPGSLTLSYTRFVPEDSLYFTTPASVGSALLARINKIDSDGSARWTAESGTELAALALGGGGDLYVVNGAGVFAFTADGALAWEFPYTNGTPTGTISVGASETVYVGYAEPDHLLAIGRDSTGARIAAWTVAGRPGPPVVGEDGSLYGAASAVGIRSLASEDGSVLWTYNASAGPYPVGVLDDGTLLGRINYALVALDEDGRELWQFDRAQNFGAAAVASDGTIYVVGVPETGSGTGVLGGQSVLYALQGPAYLASTVWPHPRHDNCNTGWFNGP